ncbi:hypothetical protein QUF58_01190 [Anaerolineales bacterium HSG24]|nr:hypothetical protein [Anaerolineales bacterium HSG24]
MIEQYWEQGKYLTTDDLVSYRNVWKRKQKSLNKISGQYGTSGRVKKSPMNVSVFKMSWQAFFQRTKNDSEHTLKGRLKVLNTAKNLFESYIHFKNMDIDTRRGIAGFGPEEEVHWHWFGSTTAAGNFKHAVIENDEHISLALDQIPLQGDVTENHYLAYVKEFEHIKGGGVATATRLLALKRPDYFICLNNQNKNGLCTAFEIPKHVTLSNYWEVVIERIIDSVWWSSKEPTNVTELAVWKYRAAFLDVLFYVPS